MFGFQFGVVRQRRPGGGGPPPIPEHPAIHVLRGMDTKAGSNVVNIGSRLPLVDPRLPAIVATSSSYEVLSGNGAHWNLPTNGSLPTTTSAGVSARLNGGPYVFAYTMSDGETTYTGELTIERDLGQSRRSVSYQTPSGLKTRAEKSFTTKCFSVSSQAELAALSASDLNGATVLLDPAYASATAQVISRSLANGCLITPEDEAHAPAIMQYLSNGGTNVEFYKVKARASASGMTAAGVSNTNMALLNTGAVGASFIDCDFEGLGDDPADWPYIRSTVNNSTGNNLWIGNQFKKVRQVQAYNAVGSSDDAPGTVISQNHFDRVSADALFIGSGAAGQTFNYLIIERNIMTRLIWDGTTIHPDFLQFATSNQAMALSNVFVHGNRMITADSTASGNAGPFTGDSSYTIPVSGYFIVTANIGSVITVYGVGSVDKFDLTNASPKIIAGNDSRRAQNGVKGASDPSATTGGAAGLAACASGAQGHYTHLPDSSPAYKYSPNNEQQFPGHYYDFAAGSNIIFDHNIVHGKAPTEASCDVLDGWHLGRTSDTTPPDYTNPNSIEPAWVGQRADPGRVLTPEDWAALDAEGVALLDEQMYAPLPTASNIVRGDGSVNGALCVPRGSARPKLSKYRVTELSAVHADGILTASLSVSVCEDVVCDVLDGGDVIGSITIPAGLTSGAGAFGAGSLTIRNDSGLVDPVVA